MRVAFVTMGVFPVPATRGGAVENLIEDLLDKNEEYKEHDFIVYSVFDESSYQKSKMYKKTHFKFFKVPKLIKFLDKCIYFISTKILKKANVISYRYIAQRCFVISHYPKVLLDDNVDLIILVTNSTLLWLLNNKKVRQRYSKKVIYYLHNEVRSFFGCEKNLKHIKSLIAISDFVVDSFMNSTRNFKRENCYVLKNCVDVEAFANPSEIKIQEYKTRYNIDENDFIVVFAGRMVEEKGALEVFNAIKKIDNSHVKLMVVGGGFYSSDVGDTYTKRLHIMAEQMENKIFFTGYVPYEEMPIIYSIANVAVLPSMWDEPAGMTMLEAVVSGLPLITTVSGGIPEYISKDVAILLDRDENLVENIAHYLIKLKDNKQFYEKYVENCNKYREKFNLDVFYKNFNSIIEI